jgi:uncharacterized protein YqgV (UPF0045/DUF77 family)
MDIGVEISLYPLHQQYIPPIQDFIDRLNADHRLRVVTNSMSTQVFGSFEEVMATLTRELRTSFDGLGAQGEKAVFVMKVLGPLPGA